MKSHWSCMKVSTRGPPLAKLRDSHERSSPSDGCSPVSASSGQLLHPAHFLPMQKPNEQTPVRNSCAHVVVVTVAHSYLLLAASKPFPGASLLSNCWSESRRTHCTTFELSRPRTADHFASCMMCIQDVTSCGCQMGPHVHMHAVLCWLHLPS